MPHATNTRHRSSRRLNSEEIEDTRQTQAQRPADDVSDDEPSQRVKKEKKGKKKAVVIDEDDEDGADAVEDDDDDDDDVIDVNNFPDQPLNKADLHKLRGIGQDWKTMHELISVKCGVFKDIAVAMAESGEKDVSSSEQLQELEAAMKEYIDLCAEMPMHAQSLDALQQKIAIGDDIFDPLDVYETSLKERMDDYALKSSRQKYLKDEHYRGFHMGIWEVNHPDAPMPPLTDIIPKEDGDESDDDDDLEMGGATQNFNCPLTLTLLTNPVTSTVCNHSFSKEAIRDYFDGDRNPKKCPTAGCNQKFRYFDCKDDPALAKQVHNYKRRKDRARKEDSDAEEVVD